MIDAAPPSTTPRRRNRPTRRSRGIPRKRTIGLKYITRAVIASGWDEVGGRELAATLLTRPRTRAECKGGIRPCPFVSCKHHLYLDVNPETGSITFNRPDLEPDQLEHSCALDVADLGGVTLEEVGLYLNVTRERVRQIEVKGKFKMRGRALETGMNEIEVGIGRLSPMAAMQELEPEFYPSEIARIA